MPLSEREELELLELEEKERGTMDMGQGRATGIREQYPSEKFAQYAEPISQFAGMFRKAPLIGSAIAGAATMGAEIGRQGIQAIGSEPGTPTTFAESGSRIAKAFGRGVAGEALGRGLFKGAGMAAEYIEPTAITATSQAMRGMAGIPQETAKKALTTDVLSTALPKKEAKEIFSNFIKESGYEYGDDAVKKSTGRFILGPDKADDFIDSVLNRVERFKGTTESGMSEAEKQSSHWAQRVAYKPEGPTPLENLPENQEAIKQLTQDALSARYAIGPAIKRFVRAGDDSMVRTLTQGRNMVDDWLETRLPGFAEVRKTYSDMQTKDAFNSIFPRSKNMSPDAVRMMVQGAGAGTALASGSVIPGVGVLAMSPKAWEYGIRSFKATSPAIKEVSKFGTRLGTQAISGKVFPSSTEELMRKHYEAQK